MTNALKKLNRQTRNSFKKLDRGADNFFKKTIPNVARKVGGYIEQGANIVDDQVIRPGLKKIDEAGDWVVDTSRKVGNTLEKYADDIAMGAGLAGSGLLYATGYGAPAAAALMSASLAAGTAGQNIGSKIKEGSRAVKSLQDKTVGLANKAYSDVRKGVNQTASQATRIANNTVADVRQAGLDLQNQAKTEYNRNLNALNSNVGMAKQMARDDIKNFVNRSKVRANMAITGGANALTDAINNAPNFV